MSKIKKNIFVENADIVDISSEGKSVAKVDGMVIFVDGGVPGDIADVMITRKKNNYAEGFYYHKDMSDSLIVNQGAAPVIVLGVSGLLVVQTPRGTLICRKGRAEEAALLSRKL